MKYGAYYNCRGEGIVWFRTARPMQTGFYHRHSHGGDPPDVYIADSVPELIMKAYPWIHREEAAFQSQMGSPASDAQKQSRITDQLTEQLIQRLDPNDDKVWVDEPLWVRHLAQPGEKRS